MEKNRLLVVYNICGISGKDNIEYYIPAVESLLENIKDNDRVIISGCVTLPAHKDRLRKHFGNKVDYIWIDEIRTISFTFNKAVMSSVQNYGSFEGYLYVDSGCMLENPETINEMYTTFTTTDAHMVSVLTDDDSGETSWFGKDLEANEKGFRVPVGKALNLHVQIFSEELRVAYGNILPDIFASYCMESIFTFLCAAIHGSWIVRTDHVVHHAWSLDGASSGFNPHGVIARIMPPHHHLVPEAPCHMETILEDPLVEKSGFGYEEVQQVKMHDPNKYTEEGYSNNEYLLPFIKDNMYLSKLSFDYDTFKGDYVCL
tara:strand:+ start:823 stop:1770 length:948 start_codon:yes stop_codon:yes gene_type:complete